MLQSDKNQEPRTKNQVLLTPTSTTPTVNELWTEQVEEQQGVGTVYTTLWLVTQ